MAIGAPAVGAALEEGKVGGPVVAGKAEAPGAPATPAEEAGIQLEPCPLPLPLVAAMS